MSNNSDSDSDDDTKEPNTTIKITDKSKDLNEEIQEMFIRTGKKVRSSIYPADKTSNEPFIYTIDDKIVSSEEYYKKNRPLNVNNRCNFYSTDLSRCDPIHSLDSFLYELNERVKVSDINNNFDISKLHSIKQHNILCDNEENHISPDTSSVCIPNYYEPIKKSLTVDQWEAREIFLIKKYKRSVYVIEMMMTMLTKDIPVSIILVARFGSFIFKSDPIALNDGSEILNNNTDKGFSVLYHEYEKFRSKYKQKLGDKSIFPKTIFNISFILQYDSNYYQNNSNKNLVWHIQIKAVEKAKDWCNILLELRNIIELTEPPRPKSDVEDLMEALINKLQISTQVTKDKNIKRMSDLHEFLTKH